MPTGPEMMLKAMGIDPQKIMGDFQLFSANLQLLVNQQKEILAGQARIEQRLMTLNTENDNGRHNETGRAAGFHDPVRDGPGDGSAVEHSLGDAHAPE